MGRLIKYELKKTADIQKHHTGVASGVFTGSCSWNLYREREYSWNQCNAGNVCRNVCIFLYGN